MSFGRLNNSTTALISILGVLVLVFGTLLSALAIYQHKHDRIEAVHAVEHEASNIGTYILESVLRNDFQNIEIFTDAWGMRHGNVAILSVRAPNGFEIARYERAAPARDPATVRHTVVYEGRVFGSVELTNDLAPALLARQDAWFAVVPYVAAFIAVLALVMWAAVRRLVLIPMERTDERLAVTAKELAVRNADLRHAVIRAEESSKTKSQFLATMSHELRTPLNAVIGFADMMRHETFGKLGSDHYVEYVSLIHDSGQHLLELINDVLDVSKIESEAMQLFPEDVPIHELVNASIRMVRDQAANRGVMLDVSMPGTVPVLSLDDRRAKQVLVNLLSNAIKFTPPGGRVELAVAHDTAKGETHITVKDNGIGMSQEDIETALSIFGQADSDLNRRYNGTGLGLPLAKKLTELQGGTLHIESEVGVGTTVMVCLPDDCLRGTVAVPPTALESDGGVSELNS